MKKNSGNASDGKSRLRGRRVLLQHAPRDRHGHVSEAPHVRTSRVRSACEAPAIAEHDDEDREAEPEGQRPAVPPVDDERADALDEVGERVVGRDRPEPLVVDQRSREARRGQEQQDEEQREEPLHRLRGARPQADQGADRGEAERDEHRQRQQREDAARARLHVQAREEADREVDQRGEERDEDDARELADEQRGALHRGHREAPQEPGLDVASERAAGVDHREQRALDERHGDREVDVVVGREAGDAASPPAGRRRSPRRGRAGTGSAAR